MLDNYINIMRNNIKNDYGITLHAENYFESSFNNNGIYSNIDFNLGNYSWYYSNYFNYLYNLNYKNFI